MKNWYTRPFSYFLFLLHKKFTGMLIIISMLNGKDFVLVLACHSARHYRMKKFSFRGIRQTVLRFLNNVCFAKSLVNSGRNRRYSPAVQALELKTDFIN